jgi:hypothetical protein
VNSTVHESRMLLLATAGQGMGGFLTTGRRVLRLCQRVDSLMCILSTLSTIFGVVYVFLCYDPYINPLYPSWVNDWLGVSLVACIYSIVLAIVLTIMRFFVWTGIQLLTVRYALSTPGTIDSVELPADGCILLTQRFITGGPTSHFLSDVGPDERTLPISDTMKYV